MPRPGKWDHDRRVVIVDGVRTPFAKAGTGLADVVALELTAVGFLLRTRVDDWYGGYCLVFQKPARVEPLTP